MSLWIETRVIAQALSRSRPSQYEVCQHGASKHAVLFGLPEPFPWLASAMSGLSQGSTPSTQEDLGVATPDFPNYYPAIPLPTPSRGSTRPR